MLQSHGNMKRARRNEPPHMCDIAPPASRAFVRDFAPMSQDPRRPPFADDSYVSLETFRKDGTGVKTPVWAAPLDGTLVVFSEGSSYKVKRLRRDPRVRVAACDMRGKVRGDWVEGTGRVIEDPAHIVRALGALRDKYGFQSAMTDFFARLTGRFGRRAYLEITLPQPS
jgi:PPOX class probable F420-dependent enzyme